MPQRIALLIDGSNFYFKLKDLKLNNQLLFNFLSFSNFLAQPGTCIIRTYYIGAVKTDGTPKMTTLHAAQQKLFKHLQSNRFQYSLGYLLKSGGRFHEKGVDVHIAVDMLTVAYENSVDKIILVSSDTDLIPAVKRVMKLHIDVDYVGFSHMYSTALKQNCTHTKLLTKDDLKPFVVTDKKKS